MTIKITVTDNNKIEVSVPPRTPVPEAIQVLINALYIVIDEARNQVLKNTPEQKDITKDLYDAVVFQFSLMVDQFNPEAKNYRTGIMSDEELKELQEMSKNGKEK